MTDPGPTPVPADARVDVASPQLPLGTEPEPVPPASPVTEHDRVHSLDVLRGVAVLGILYMNIQSFAMPDPAYGIPVSWGDFSGLNYYVWLAGRLFADQKFMTVFSMLFGAGVILMTERLTGTNRPTARVHYRRMIILLIFGLLHSYFLWTGDILYHYALCGMIIYLLRDLRPPALFATGFGMLAMGSLILLVFGLGMSMTDPDAGARMNWNSLEATATTAAQWEGYRGTWSEQMALRIEESIAMHTWIFAIFMLWRIVGVMLLGMALYKLGVLSARLRTRTYAAIFFLTAAPGLLVEWSGIHHIFRRDWNYIFVEFIGGQYNYWSSVLLAVSWIAIIMIYCRRTSAESMEPSASAVSALLASSTAHRLACVGRMAFTNYIAQTVICTTIFYGHGLGLYGDVSRTGQLGITVAVWVAQLLYSPLWLHYFRMGPLEWLWRTLTYATWQPLLRRGSARVPDTATAL